MTETAKKARAEYQKAYREKNRERLNKYRRNWNKENPDKIQKYQETYWNKKAEEALKGGVTDDH